MARFGTTRTTGNAEQQRISSCVVSRPPVPPDSLARNSHRADPQTQPNRANSSSRIDQIAELREGRGWSYPRIAHALGITPGAVAWTCLMNAIEKPGLARKIPNNPAVRLRGGLPVRQFSAADDNKLLSLERQGCGLREMARNIGRAPSAVRARLAILARREARAEGVR